MILYGLVPLLAYLKNSHANIWAKAADVVTTIVQNNPWSQQLVMEANGFEPLVSNFSSDPDVNVRAIWCFYDILFLKLEWYWLI
jgi:hsp70-interacting protein